jgi:uncharacterized protein
MVFKTLSDTQYHYDYRTNYISIVDAEPAEGDCFIQYANPADISALPNLDTFVIEMTRNCNLRCSYCCYSGAYRNNRKHEQTALTEGCMDRILDFIKANRKTGPVIIGFYGGESLLEFNLIQYCVEKAEAIWNKNVSFTLSTNGVLLNSNKIDWLVNHQVQLNISLDGCRVQHDKYRRIVGGKGSYDFIYNNLLLIKQSYPSFFENKVGLLMTLQSIDDLKEIAIEWQSDPLLSVKAPAHISGLSPNYTIGEPVINENSKKRILYELFDYYSAHPDNLVLRTFFSERTDDFRYRSVFDLTDKNTMSTCLPNNRKCFIDVTGEIGVCEKMCDSYRIGNIYTGFDYAKINSMVRQMADIRCKKCSNCSIARLCDTCLLALDLSDEELAVSCENQRINTKLYMRLLCELVECGLIQ